MHYSTKVAKRAERTCNLITLTYRKNKWVLFIATSLSPSSNFNEYARCRIIIPPLDVAVSFPVCILVLGSPSCIRSFF